MVQGLLRKQPETLWYDLWTLANQFAFEGDQFCTALRATFARRASALPGNDEEPGAFTSRFSDDSTKRPQRAAFLRKERLAAEPKPDLLGVLAVLRTFLLPPCAAIAAGQVFVPTWAIGGNTPTSRPCRDAVPRQSISREFQMNFHPTTTNFADIGVVP